MKISYILASPYICGGNRIAITHANKLAERGHKVFIAIIENNRKLDWIKLSPGVKVIPFDALPATKSDIIVSTYWETQEIYAKRMREKCKAVNFYFIQQLEDRFFKSELLKQRVIETYKDIRKNGKVITEAKWLKEALKKQHGISATLVPNCQEISPDLKLCRKQNKKLIVLFEGNAEVPTKGYQDFINAIKLIREKEFNKWVLTNSKKKNIPASSYLLDKLFCEKNWTDALRIIKTADILVKPTYFEGSPTPIMEAMQLGTAVVAYNCDGMSEYCVDGKNALLSPIGNSEILAENILRLLRDDSLRNQLVKNGLETSKQFDNWEKNISVLEKAFKKAIE